MKILLVVFTICLTFTSPFWDPGWKTEKYCASLRDGVMVLLKDGMIVTSEVILSDSTKITTDCVVIKKDGTKIGLKDGECITSDQNKNKVGTENLTK